MKTRLERKRVSRVKRAFTTRRVPVTDMHTLLTGNVRPRAGDVVLARVDEIGKHTRLELIDGRRAIMFPGDEIVVAFGNRYAPDQFEAIVGDDLSVCDLVAAGGIASCELSRHERMTPPTRISPIGLVGDVNGKRLNLISYAIGSCKRARPIPTILVAGTSMNSGKTITSASVVRGLKAAGHRVAALKATGTGAGGDLWIQRDAGADVILDFTDAGFASTYKASPEQIEKATFRLIAHASDAGCDFAVIEIADGVQQEETEFLLRSKSLRLASVGILFAAFDAMGAKSGVDTLSEIGHRVLAVSGKLARSPLMIREAEKATRQLILTPIELQDAAIVQRILEVAHVQTGTLTRSQVFPTASRSEPSRDCSRDPRIQQVSASMPRQLRSTRQMSVGNGKKDGFDLRHTSTSEPIARVDHYAKRVNTYVVREMLRFVTKLVMEVEVDRQCHARRGVRSAGRVNRRNGYRDRPWETPIGHIVISVPRLKRGGYVPAFLKPCQNSRGQPAEKKLMAFIRKVCEQGVSPQSARNFFKAMGITKISRSRVLEFCDRINELAQDLPKWEDTGSALRRDDMLGRAAADERHHAAGPGHIKYTRFEGGECEFENNIERDDVALLGPSGLFS